MTLTTGAEAGRPRPGPTGSRHTTARAGSKTVLFNYYPSTFEKIIVQVSSHEKQTWAAPAGPGLKNVHIYMGPQKGGPGTAQPAAGGRCSTPLPAHTVAGKRQAVLKALGGEYN